MFVSRVIVVTLAIASVGDADPIVQDSSSFTPIHSPSTGGRELTCGTTALEAWLDDQGRGRADGAIRRAAPPSSAFKSRAAPTPVNRGGGCISGAHIFPFEDSAQVMVSDYSTDQLLELVVAAGNALIAAHGDVFDFVGIWFNFPLHHNNFGEAVYFAMENDVSGIGFYDGASAEFFNRREEFGLASVNVEGFPIMLDPIGSSTWQSGTGPGADFTRMAVSHELAHRFINDLPDLADGRQMQGVFDSCGKAGHWHWKVDGQGSVMHVSEWVGSNPAVRVGGSRNLDFNHEIGGVFSYLDLYLMGYISSEEVSAWITELRYMDDSDCQSPYFGPISHFTIDDIIATVGLRVPDADAEDHHYRMGWVMIHQPGDPPSVNELNKAVAIHQQQSIDWALSTLQRGSMDHSLFTDCNCNDVPDDEDIANGTAADVNGNGIIDACEGAVPATSTWALVIMSLLVLVVGVVLIYQRNTRYADIV